MIERARKVRAAAVQLTPVLYSREGTTEHLCEWIGKARAEGAELVVFPETVVPYYPYFSFIKPPVQIGADHLLLMDQSVDVPGPTTERIGRAAREHGVVVVVGVNERDHGTLYNTQLVFDADGSLVLRRRKVTPTYHERMIWGQGHGDGLHAVDTRVGRVGALACWEHYNPLARYALMADHEQIHVAMFPGSLVGDIFRQQMEVTVRHHALESGCFVVNSTAYLPPELVRQVAGSTGLERALEGGCFTAIVSPEGSLLAPPLTEGEGMVVADLDFRLIQKRKRMMDSVGHYSRPELLSLALDQREHCHLVRTPATTAAPPSLAPEASLQPPGDRHASSASASHDSENPALVALVAL